MAATIFKNVKTVTVGGVSITSPLTLSLEYEGAMGTDKVDGGAYPSEIAVGAQVRKITVTCRDPITALSARGAKGACSFILVQGGDASGDTTAYTLADGTCGNFSFESGEPGEYGVATIECQLTGSDTP